ncbi:ribosome silencing factor [Fructilactobacillus carniphilus]|uniref:Ribosomal silencing factor RsfS n=1 Tax=Fructilactobacillus carniphilus TaxID=2940297 RepID=A0ABY5BXF4_9LACO|nr:ribosome silencing factor [Fructilactobacillus carniphilus]USS91177.1 ribosome silencing factor [Fructilactobacillus carniphilus]
MNNQAILETVVKAADERRAHDIVVLNIEKLSVMGRYFVIMDADSDRQVKAIANNIIDKLEEQQISISHVEGKDQANWILIEAGEVIVHVFKKETREFYNLEKLWTDAQVEDISAWITED